MGDVNNVIVIEAAPYGQFLDLCGTTPNNVFSCYLQSVNTIVLLNGAGNLDEWHERCHVLLGPLHNRCGHGYAFGDYESWCNDRDEQKG